MGSSRLEAWLQGVASDRERVARWFVAAYWISTLVMLLGAALIIWYFVGRGR